MKQIESNEIAGPDAGAKQLPDGSALDPISAWEEIAPGRYMPRRVRGSCHGRVLG